MTAPNPRQAARAILATTAANWARTQAAQPRRATQPTPAQVKA